MDGSVGALDSLLESAGKPVSVGVLVTQGAGFAQPGCQGVEGQAAAGECCPSHPPVRGGR